MRKLINLVTESAAPQSLQDVAKHFLFMDSSLLDDDDWEWFDEDNMTDEQALYVIRQEYVSGSCHAFSVALHDKLKLPLVLLPGHAALQAPDGEIIDFDGKLPLAKVLRRYGIRKKVQPVVVSREEMLSHALADEGDDPWDEVNVAKWVINRLGRW